MRRRSLEEERLHRKQRLAAALRIFADRGFDEGAGGHMTVRDPIEPDRFWINPFGMYFGHVRVSDLLLVDHDGTVLDGEGTVNPAGYAIHSQIHAQRPDTVAAVHLHTVYGRALSALLRPIEPISQDACAFFERQAIYPDYSGVVLDPDEGKRIARCLGDGIAVVLRNHGLLTAGASVEEAAWWFVSMERCAQVQLIAEAAGPTHRIDDEHARAARDVIGTPGIARLNFRPLYADITARQPSLLD